MPSRPTIVIDTLGSDRGPETVIEGAKLVLAENPDLNLTLVGNEEQIRNSGIDLSRVKIIHAPHALTNYDNPVAAFYDKSADYSVFKALEEVGKDENAIGMISSGSTGALFVGVVRYLLDEERHRPALAAILPATTGGVTCLVDTGASIDCGPRQLVEFAHLGSDFMKKLYKIESPRVGLLSNGSEPGKGNKVVKETHQLLAADKSINFIGNIEGNHALTGDCDVLVADGFAGNQVLKNTEGTALVLIGEMMKWGKMTGHEMEAKMIAGHLMKTYDFQSLGAGVMLGVRKYVLKCRGSSNADSIKNVAKILVNVHNNKTFYE